MEPLTGSSLASPSVAFVTLLPKSRKADVVRGRGILPSVEEKQGGERTESVN